MINWIGIIMVIVLLLLQSFGNCGATPLNTTTTTTTTTEPPQQEPQQQQSCPGICSHPGEELLNPDKRIQFRDGTDTTNQNIKCGIWDILCQTHPKDSSSCIRDSRASLEGGCQCGIPTICSGICPHHGQVLTNPNQMVDILGTPAVFVKLGFSQSGELSNTQTTENTCHAFDTVFRQETGTRQCAEHSTKALQAGCQCGDPSSSSSSSRIPIHCPGICSEEGEVLWDPHFQVQLKDDGPWGPCGGIDSMIQQFETTDPEECTNKSSRAIEAGCQCTSEGTMVATGFLLLAIWMVLLVVITITTI